MNKRQDTSGLAQLPQGTDGGAWRHVLYPSLGTSIHTALTGLLDPRSAQQGSVDYSLTKEQPGAWPCRGSRGYCHTDRRGEQ